MLPRSFRPRAKDPSEDGRFVRPNLLSCSLTCGYQEDSITIDLGLSSEQVSDVKLLFHPKDNNVFVLDFALCLQSLASLVEVPTTSLGFLQFLESVRFDFEFESSFPEALASHATCAIRVDSDFSAIAPSPAIARPTLVGDVLIEGRILSIRILTNLEFAVVSLMASQLGAALPATLQILSLLFSDPLHIQGQIVFPTADAELHSSLTK